VHILNHLPASVCASSTQGLRWSAKNKEI